MMTDTKRIAICPGSFDPITLGHVDIILRSLSIVDEVVVAVGRDPTQQKNHLFRVEERLEMIAEVFSEEPGVIVTDFEGLLVDFAVSQGASLIIRGLRSVKDFEYELQMAQMNRALSHRIETVFLTPDPEFSFISSTLVRQIASLGRAVDRFVPQEVAQRISNRKQ